MSLRLDPAARAIRVGVDGGAYVLPSCEPGWSLFFILSNGLGWEHVSVRAQQRNRTRIPTWKEMCQVKAACWDPEDTVIQVHPPASRYVNVHPHVLHLWRPIGQAVPLPPLECV